MNEGDTLVVLDDADYRARARPGPGGLRGGAGGGWHAGLHRPGRRSGPTAQGQSAATDAQIAAAQANYDKAMSDLQRTRQLADQQIVSRQQLDAAEATADAARATLIAAQKQAAAAGATVTNAQAGVRLAQARLAAAQAEEQQAALNESYTRIIAPVSGVLSRKQVELGQLVQSGQTLFTVVADTGVWVDANYKETQLDDIRVGQSVQLDVDAYGGRTFNGASRASRRPPGASSRCSHPTTPPAISPRSSSASRSASARPIRSTRTRRSVPACR